MIPSIVSFTSTMSNIGYLHQLLERQPSYGRGTEFDTQDEEKIYQNTLLRVDGDVGKVRRPIINFLSLHLWSG